MAQNAGPLDLSDSSIYSTEPDFAAHSHQSHQSNNFKTPQYPSQSSTEGPRPTGQSVPVSWDPAVQLDAPELKTDKLQSSAASHSSVISDFGNTQYLADNRASSHALSSRDSRASTAELVAHLGGGTVFTSTIGYPELTENDIAATGDSQQEAETYDSSTEQLSFGETIRAALKESQTTAKGKYLPLDALDTTVTRDRVLQELTHHKVRPPEELSFLTDRIWEVVTLPSSAEPRRKNPRKTTRRKIFAILGLMEKFEEIVGFVDNGLYDSDLPFMLSDGKRPGLLQLYQKVEDDNLNPIPLFEKWKAHELESFANYQWQLTAPYFRLSTEDKPKVRHYNLEDNSILPFIEDDEVKRNSGRNGGGFGDVWRVKIHPAHHNCCRDSTNPNDNPSYAVKRLRHNNYDAFNAEVSNLKRFSEKDHVHLIKLLVTFTWREQFYLIFPWADGNLLDFWKMNAQPSDPKRDRKMALWFSEQCLGIVQGLEMIHTADRPSTDDLSTAADHPIHGRHGDLKPENILWFKPWQNTHQSGFGVFKISDFGLTRFHGTQSKSHFETVAVSPTYRPPEYDIAAMVSQSYDIWTLGCVLLEFITWYLRGWKGVDGFSKKRTTDDNREIPEDVFFNFVKIRDNDGMIPGARAKLSVANEFEAIYQHPNCSEYLSDLVTFIKDKMLRMGPKKRAVCQEIVEKFQELHKYCSTDPDYCTKRAKVPPRRSSTDLSELAASAFPSLSPAMVARINRHRLPEHTGPLENDSDDSQSPDSQSLASQSLAPITGGTMQPGSKNTAVSELQLKGITTETFFTVLEDPSASPTSLDGIFPSHHVNGATVESPGQSDDETASSRPQSSSRNLKVHFKESEHMATEADQSQKLLIQPDLIRISALAPGSPSYPVTRSASRAVLQRAPKNALTISEEPFRSFSDPELTISSPKSISCMEEMEAPMVDSSVDADHAKTLPPEKADALNPETQDSSNHKGQKSKTQIRKLEEEVTVANAPQRPDQDQPNAPKILATKVTDGGDAVTQAGGLKNEPPLEKHPGLVKRLFHSICCFPY